MILILSSHWLVGVTLDGKKVLVVGARGPLEPALQFLFQRKGSMTMSSPWATPQLQGKVGVMCDSITLNAYIRQEETLAMCKVNTEQEVRGRMVGGLEG